MNTNIKRDFQISIGVPLKRVSNTDVLLKNTYFQVHLQTAASWFFLLEWSRLESISHSILDLEDKIL